MQAAVSPDCVSSRKSLTLGFPRVTQLSAPLTSSQFVADLDLIVLDWSSTVVECGV